MSNNKNNTETPQQKQTKTPVPTHLLASVIHLYTLGLFSVFFWCPRHARDRCFVFMHVCVVHIKRSFVTVHQAMLEKWGFD